MKPLIGLTSQHEYSNNIKLNKVNNTYIDAIQRAGAVPIILPVVEEIEFIDRYLDVLQGVVLTGGEDISPLLYGQEPSREVDTISFDRDSMEMEIFKKSYSKNIPVLGICRGIQMINVALGGTLYQDIYREIPNAIGHISGFSISGGYHTIEIVKDSKMYEIFNKENIQVNSQHHQSVRDVGKNLKVNAYTSDGVVEGIESTNDKFVLGVQFHPEAMVYRNKEILNIFKYFIDHCK